MEKLGHLDYRVALGHMLSILVPGPGKGDGARQRQYLLPLGPPG